VQRVERPITKKRKRTRAKSRRITRAMKIEIGRRIERDLLLDAFLNLRRIDYAVDAALNFGPLDRKK
jgi:hypothetical protein